MATRNSSGVRDALSWRAPESHELPVPSIPRSSQDIIGWTGSADSTRPAPKAGGKKALPTESSGGFNPILGSFADEQREIHARDAAANAAAAAVIRKQRALPPSLAHSDGTAVDIISATRKTVEPSTGEVAQQRRLHAAALRYRQDPLIVLKDKEAEANDQRRIARIQRRCVCLRSKCESKEAPYFLLPAQLGGAA